jgi:hypothetical protein
MATPVMGGQFQRTFQFQWHRPEQLLQGYRIIMSLYVHRFQPNYLSRTNIDNNPIHWKLLQEEKRKGFIELALHITERIDFYF